MSKTILLTTASVITFSVAIYAHSDILSERESLVGYKTESTMFEMKGNMSDLSKQVPVPYSAHPKLTKELGAPGSLTDSVVVIDPKKVFLTDSLVMVEPQVSEKLKTTEDPRPKMHEDLYGPKLAGFTIDEAIKYGKLASMAYVDVASPEGDKDTFAQIEKLQAEGNRVQFFGTEAENSGMIVTHNDGRISVVYKGSNSARNFATDGWANFAIDDKTGLRCHNGIMKGFYRTQEQVFAILNQIAETRGVTIEQLLQKYVTVTGHSLGGGLTLMFAGYAYEIYGVTVKLVTFATPRIFDIATAKKFDALFHDIYLNVMQVTDPVPGIALGLLGYKHFGTKLHIPYALADWQHLMSGYLKALEGIAHVGALKVGDTVFKYEESQRSGVGNAKWIGNTSIPNPVYPIYQARQLMAENVDPVVHKVVKAVKDGAINVVTKTADVAKQAGTAVVEAASTVASSIGSAASKAWSWFTS